MKKIITLLLITILLGCEEEIKVNKSLLTDNPIDISGSWTIESVFQNEMDITLNYDFSSFRLDLNYNGETPSTYAITSDGSVPFATVVEDGSWAFDNLLYPLNIHFIQGDTMTVELGEALYSTGNTTVVLEFNLGCSENVYAYHLTKNESL